MKVIRANCRIQFTPQDMAFLLKTLERESDQRGALQRLFSDNDTRSLLLDSDPIFEAIVDRPENLPISLHLFFYVLVRRVLTRFDIDDEDVADYVAELLTEFTRSNQSTKPSTSPTADSTATGAWLDSLSALDRRECFEHKAYIANQLLFLTGIQEDWLRQRTERRGAPSVEFYEQVGPRFFHDAGQHELAESYDLKEIFELLSRRFHDTRLLHLDDPAVPILEPNQSIGAENPDREEPPTSFRG